MSGENADKWGTLWRDGILIDVSVRRMAPYEVPFRLDKVVGVFDRDRFALFEAKMFIQVGIV